jgi:hypothetical protein
MLCHFIEKLKPLLSATIRISNIQNQQYLRSFTVIPISGTQQPTLQSATLINGELIASEELPAILQNRSDLGDGGGTVPKISAIPIERSKDLNNFFIAEQHGSLQNQAQVLDNILNALRISQFELADARKSELELRGSR